MDTSKRFTTVAIIGAGFSGIGIACQLKGKLGFGDFAIFERSSGLGGTWYSNQYPGCGVDVPAMLYSLSFAPNTNFSRLFPDRLEILNYVQKLAIDNGIDSSISYDSCLVKAEWQEKTKTWLLTFKVGQSNHLVEHECRVLISAVGRLVIPNTFNVPGQSNFQGKILHSSQWTSDIDILGKDVIVVGNGCSGSQIVPAIANHAKSVCNFMRTPQYYVRKPMDHLRFGSTLKYLFKFMPFLLQSFRLLFFLFLEMTLKSFSFEQSAQYSRERVQKRSLAYVERTAPVMYWDLLTPKYALGCKRKILDPGYLKALHKKTVHLTNDRIVSLDDSFVVAASGTKYPADIIIVANGFRTFSYEMCIVGRHGQTLQDHWKHLGGIGAYKTTSMAGFPNLFLLSGPNSVSGHSSSLFSIERTIELIIKVIKPVLKGEVRGVEIKHDAEQKWVHEVQHALRSRVYADNCSTYYVDQNTGWNFTNYPWSFIYLWWSTKFTDVRDWCYSM